MNPLDIPQTNRRNRAWYNNDIGRYLLFAVLVVLCVYETLALHGGLPNPPLASFYGIAAVYTYRTRF